MRLTLRPLLLSAGLSLMLAACATSKPEAVPPAPAATPAPAPPAATPAPPKRNPAGPASEATLTQYRTWINEARVKHPYPDSADRMYAVMMCESRGQATIVNPFGPYKGLFQYGGPTWGDKWNVYRDQGILDPRAQIFATALAWSLKMQSHWGCYKKTA